MNAALSGAAPSRKETMSYGEKGGGGGRFRAGRGHEPSSPRFCSWGGYRER